MAQFGSAQALSGIHAVGVHTIGRCTKRMACLGELLHLFHLFFLCDGLQGKWMFEVTLVTAGVQQLGWATMSTPFTHEARLRAPGARCWRW